MTNRYYSPDAKPEALVTLDGPEAHHLLHVMRAAEGEQIELFDGRGNAFPATVTHRSRSSVNVQTQAALKDESGPLREVTIGVALPKGDRQRWLIEKCTELGASRIVPLITERSVAAPKDAGGKLLRYAIEACKQCGRNHLTEITAPMKWGDWITSDASSVRLVADPESTTAAAATVMGSNSISFSIGPEGGLTREEVAAAKGAGWKTVSLGPHVLRIETAAAACVAVAVLGQPMEGVHADPG